MLFFSQPNPQANNLINALCYELRTAADTSSSLLSLSGTTRHEDNGNECGGAISDYKTFRKEMSKYDLTQAVFSQGERSDGVEIRCRKCSH